MRRLRVYQKNEEDSWETQFFQGDSEYSQKHIFIVLGFVSF